MNNIPCGNILTWHPLLLFCLLAVRTGLCNWSVPLLVLPRQETERTDNNGWLRTAINKRQINIFGETLTSVDWDNVWTVFVGLTPHNCSNDPWTTQIRSRTLFWSTDHSFQLQLSHSSLGNQTSGTTGHALTTMLDYRKCYVELSQGRGWGAVKLRILLTCAETVCKYFSYSSHWMLINRAAWWLWSNFGCILETRLLGEVSFPCVLVIPEAASFVCWGFTDNSKRMVWSGTENSMLIVCPPGLCRDHRQVLKVKKGPKELELQLLVTSPVERKSISNYFYTCSFFKQKWEKLSGSRFLSARITVLYNITVIDDIMKSLLASGCSNLKT